MKVEDLRIEINHHAAFQLKMLARLWKLINFIKPWVGWMNLFEVGWTVDELV